MCNLKAQIEYDKEFGRRYDEKERRKAIRENVAAFLIGAGVVAIGMLYLNGVLGG